MVKIAEKLNVMSKDLLRLRKDIEVAVFKMSEIHGLKKDLKDDFFS
jgi:hypothetical protein